MSEQHDKVEADRQAIVAARQKGTLATVGTYTRLSGPGWLQSALTLGGGSLGSSLYLGVLAGFGLLWLQPMAMILGIIMLSAIGYVAMSTRERPFPAINRHINPVLGWGWALASLLANMVWCLPQYSLASGVLQQNLLPDVLGAQSEMGSFWGKVAISASILLVTLIVTWAYDSGGWGIKLYELTLKLVVAGIVICFFAVVTVITVKGAIKWGNVFAGLVPDFTKVYQPADSFGWLLEAVPAGVAEFWSKLIVQEQRDVMISAAATAVGINMTFLLPYSMLRRGWDRDFRGLAKFDLATGMLIPFMLATSCVVIASANQFHPDEEAEKPLLAAGEGNELPLVPLTLTERLRQGKLEDELGAEKFAALSEEQRREQSPELTANEVLATQMILAVDYKVTASRMADLSPEEIEDRLSAFAWREVNNVKKLLTSRLKKEMGEEAFGALTPEQAEARLGQYDRAEVLLSVHLQRKDAFDLSKSLAPLTGRTVADILFGVGVVGMTLSSITLLMLISGFVICEMLGVPPKGWPNRLGALAATTGVVGPFLWASQARFWLVVPTSVFCFTLLPFAYVTFFLMMNSKNLLGKEMPTGGRRVAWNLAMGVAVIVATSASIYMVWVKGGFAGLAVVAALAALVVFVHFAYPRNAKTSRES